MARYLMIALNGPTAGPGDEADCNAWHDDVHLPDFKSFAEVKSARRFKVERGHTPGADGPAPWPMADWPYASVYEIETDDMAALSKRFATEMRPFPPTLDRTRSAHLLAVQISGDGLGDA